MGLTIAGRSFEWGRRTYLMGIINLTPDSFSGDGLDGKVSAAVARAREFVEAGADILDLGGESTRPNAEPVDEAEEMRRLLPVVAALRADPVTNQVPLSIDTLKPNVALAAVQCGAHLINDIGGLQDPAMVEVAVQSKVPVIIMHSRGNPKTMMQLADYDGFVIWELERFFEERVREVSAAGVLPENIILDPGIGFAKTAAQNLEILRGLSRLRNFGLPLLVGVSRKAFIGRLVAGAGRPPVPPGERLYGTVAAVALAIAGGADIVRVHDVAALAGAVRVADAISRPASPEFAWL